MVPAYTKVYLGDGAYAEWDGYNLVLTTEDGTSKTNIIYLEADVLEQLKRFIAQVEARS
jgi:hypothetical protein